MNGIFGIVVFALINHALGAYIWYDVQPQQMMRRCFDANSTMPAGEIIDFCEKRLYLKEDK